MLLLYEGFRLSGWLEAMNERFFCVDYYETSEALPPPGRLAALLLVIDGVFGASLVGLFFVTVCCMLALVAIFGASDFVNGCAVFAPVAGGLKSMFALPLRTGNLGALKT